MHDELNISQVFESVPQDSYQNRTLKVGLILGEPFVNNCTDYYKCKRPGMAVELAIDIAKLLNYRLDFTLVNHQNYGGLTVNNTWVGMLGEIHEGKFDTSAPMFTPTPSRVPYFDFSENVFTLSNAFIYRKPPVAGVSITSLLFPFHWLVCLLIVLSVFAVGSAMIWFDIIWIRSHAGQFKEDAADPSHPFALRWFETLVTTLAMALNQGTDINFVWVATQILVGVWALTTVVLSALYSAVLLSSLLSAPLELPFKDVHGYTQCQASGKCTTYSPSLELSRFETIAIDTTQKFVEVREALKANPMRVEPLYADIMPKIQASKPPNFVVYWDVEFMLLNYASRQCDLVIMRDGLGSERNMFPFRKGDLLASSFSKAFTKLREYGIYEYILQKYVRERLCDDSGGHEMEHKPFPLRSIFGPLTILAIGSILAAFVLSSECCAHRKTRNILSRSFRALRKLSSRHHK